MTYPSAMTRHHPGQPVMPQRSRSVSYLACGLLLLSTILSSSAWAQSKPGAIEQGGGLGGAKMIEPPATAHPLKTGPGSGFSSEPPDSGIGGNNPGGTAAPDYGKPLGEGHNEKPAMK